MGKFIVRETKTGYMFDLKASNGETIATSEVYNSESACLNGVASVKKNGPIANLEDLTSESKEKVVNPKFEVYCDKAGEYRFRLKARNGEIIAVSEGYKEKRGCMNGIESVRKNADSKIENRSKKSDGDGVKTVVQAREETIEVQDKTNGRVNEKGGIIAAIKKFLGIK